jgi:hypothetical protein
VKLHGPDGENGAKLGRVDQADTGNDDDDSQGSIGWQPEEGRQQEKCSHNDCGGDYSRYPATRTRSLIHRRLQGQDTKNSLLCQEKTSSVAAISVYNLLQFFNRTLLVKNRN